MLRLVHPAPKGQVSARPKGRRAAVLTPSKEEQDRIHAALKTLIRAHGTRKALAAIMGVDEMFLRGKRPRSYTLAILLARAAGIPVEQILRPGLHEAGACTLCGRKGER